MWARPLALDLGVKNFSSACAHLCLTSYPQHTSNCLATQKMNSVHTQARDKQDQTHSQLVVSSCCTQVHEDKAHPLGMIACAEHRLCLWLYVAFCYCKGDGGIEAPDFCVISTKCMITRADHYLHLLHARFFLCTGDGGIGAPRLLCHHKHTAAPHP